MIKPTLSRRQFLASTAAAGAATLASPAYAQSRELVIISNRGSAGQRAALEAIAQSAAAEEGGAPMGIMMAGVGGVVVILGLVLVRGQVAGGSGDGVTEGALRRHERPRAA